MMEAVQVEAKNSRFFLSKTMQNTHILSSMVSSSVEKSPNVCFGWFGELKMPKPQTQINVKRQTAKVGLATVGQNTKTPIRSKIGQSRFGQSRQ